MARRVAALPAGSRITDYISLGVISRTFPRARVRGVLAATDKASVRQRDLPAHVVVYYVIALALYMQSSYREVLRCLLEGIQWLLDPSAVVKVAGKSGISQARTRLGWEPLRQLHDAVVRPIAIGATKGAWYRSGGWSVWMAVHWKSLTSWPTKQLSVVPEPAAVTVPIRRSALYHWWKTAPTCCLAAGWRTIGRLKSP